MNKSIIRYILGWVLMLEGMIMLLPCLVAVIYREQCGWYFLLVAACSFFVGLLIRGKKPERTTFYLKEGCITTALSWIVISAVGCVPFVLSGEIPSYVDALFEMVSGFTTTGASILTDVEALSYCMLFWRSFSHWLGGMGVLVFLLAVIQMTGGSNMNLMRAESTGPSVGKLMPKIRHSARTLYLIYTGMTILLIILLLAGRMPVFDALTTAFGTAGTGGFGIKADSMAGYSPYLQWVVAIFMLLFGVNFNAFYFILLRKWRQAFRMEEVRGYCLIVGISIAIITANIYNTATTFEHNLRDATFQVASIISTTGFATVDFNLWPQTSRLILILLMLVGACAGSTAGGLKVSRLILLLKSVIRELGSYLHPKSVKKIKMDGKPVDHEVLRGVNVFLVSYILIFGVSVFCLSFENHDLVTNFTAVAATFNNIGPGMNLVGPTASFAMFTDFNKLVLTFDMLAGRLELFPMLLLFYPPLWKGFFKRSKKQH